MGRLTLNVLLSFAQFEREVTSERIRDKIAVSVPKTRFVRIDGEARQESDARQLGQPRARMPQPPDQFQT
jgi:DNA invertase Pin-like site-specific DNA recombinase